VSERLDVDMTKCTGHGVCALLARDRVDLDAWGYPTVDPTPVSGRSARQARRAVSACPRQALILRTEDPARLTVTP
jgi:ferredoxin